MRSTLALALAISLCNAHSEPLQPPTALQAKAPSPNPHSDVVALLDSIQTLPVEYRAELTFAAIESGKLPLSAKPELIQDLQELFRDAERANLHSPVETILPGEEILENQLPPALRFYKLDGLSIRLRALRELREYAPSQSAELFHSLQVSIPRQSCASVLGPTLPASYAQLNSLARELLANPRDQSAYLDWLSAQLATTTSPLQLAPLAGLIDQSAADGPNFSRLLSAFELLLKTTEASDRELAVLENDQLGLNATLFKAIDKLAKHALDQGLDHTSLLESYRTFLMRNAAQPRCRDFAMDWPHVLAEFNGMVESLGCDRQSMQLDPSQFGRAPLSDEKPAVHPLLPTPALDELFQRVFQWTTQSRFGDAVQKEQAGKSLEGAYDEFLRQMDLMAPEKAECPECACFTEGKLLLVFLDLAPSEYYHHQILRRLIHILSASPLQSDWRVLWAFQVNLLANLSRKPSKEQQHELVALQTGDRIVPMLPGPYSAMILLAMRSSSDEALSLYGLADETLKPPFFSPYLESNHD